MKRNKIGIIFLVSMLAMAGIGMSYAGFTDVINVSGTVDTATVDLTVTGYSCTYVWKIWNINNGVLVPTYVGLLVDPINEIATYHGLSIDPAYIEALFAGYSDIERESWAIASSGGDDVVTVEYHNLFPCIDFMADFVVQYQGTIPVKVNIAQWITYSDPWLAELAAIQNAVTITAVDQTGAAVDIGTQLHTGDVITVTLTIHLPQDNYWQTKTGTFTAQVGVIQWNEG